MISDHDKQNVQPLLESGTSYVAMLLRLIENSDRNEFAKLMLMYPDECEAFARWYFGDGDPSNVDPEFDCCAAMLRNKFNFFDGGFEFGDYRLTTKEVA